MSIFIHQTPLSPSPSPSPFSLSLPLALSLNICPWPLPAHVLPGLLLAAARLPRLDTETSVVSVFGQGVQGRWRVALGPASLRSGPGKGRGSAPLSEQTPGSAPAQTLLLFSFPAHRIKLGLFVRELQCLECRALVPL